MKHPLCVKHPPSVKYARCFLSELIRKVSNGHCLVARQHRGLGWLSRSRLCLALPVGAWICPMPFTCSAHPNMSGHSLCNCSWLGSTSQRLRGDRRKKGQGISPSVLQEVSSSSCISSVVPAPPTFLHQPASPQGLDLFLLLPVSGLPHCPFLGVSGLAVPL